MVMPVFRAVAFRTAKAQYSFAGGMARAVLRDSGPEPHSCAGKSDRPPALCRLGGRRRCDLHRGLVSRVAPAARATGGLWRVAPRVAIALTRRSRRDRTPAPPEGVAPSRSRTAGIDHDGLSEHDRTCRADVRLELDRRVHVVSLETADRPVSVLQKMTPAERAVAMVLADGFSNREIADRLGQTVDAVKFLLHRVYQKTGVPSRAALVAVLRSRRTGRGSVGRGEGRVHGRLWRRSPL
jgi:DNA-binding CsgD family transcriptional regulator